MSKEWIEGCRAGSELVLEFLKEVKNIDFEEEFKELDKFCNNLTKFNGGNNGKN